MKNTQSGDMVVTPEGQVLIPEGVPGDIMALIQPYIKVGDSMSNIAAFTQLLQLMPLQA